ncbi:hypothetical protein [Nocardia cyriacigeorgica]|uniref:hypothetical protein n=1 Tax=Nocardia cyriacigeorgica TaxID=135487 RepID=UPI0024937BD2|nr:hypothetical protein [Nocardia cyriacigeorgica]BDU04540.1 hypothetical protein FMUBM48_08030 [Nocardia cyriacigeorgica]
MDASNRGWFNHKEYRPESPLGVMRAAFGRMAGEPVPPGVARVDRAVSWGELRELLLDPVVPIAAVDAIWVRLIERSRRDGEAAVVACVGVALPMLAGLTRRVAKFWMRSREDVEATVVAGFVTELARVDLGRPYVLHRIGWATYRCARAWALADQAAPCPDADLTGVGDHHPAGRHVGTAPAGHPELVLADAVAEGVITPKAAELIATTRLERRSLTVVAAERGGSYKALQQVRRRAERKLATWLTERYHDHDHEEPAAPPTGHAAAGRERGGVRARGRGRVSVLNTDPPGGVCECGRPSAGPAQPAAMEVNRRCA